ncbi:MAG: LamG domain-containing protein, partial [Phycisphaerales bacterium]
LVGWWKFDEGSGTEIFDSSGYENNGTVHENVSWADGKLGLALQFDGSPGHCEIPFSDSLRILNEGDFTITAWLLVNEVPPSTNRLVLQQTDLNGTGRSLLFVHSSNEIRTFAGGAATSSGVGVVSGEWIHAAVVVTEQGATDSIQMYVNGQPSGPANTSLGMESCEGIYHVGSHKNTSSNNWDGLIDDLRIYNHALSEVELLSVMEGSGGEYPYSSNPNPSDGVLLEATWANMSWRAGDSAVSHDVYIGENFDDVNDGNPGSPVFQGNQTDASLIIGFFGFPIPGGLVPGTTYYWRIDEVNEADPNSPWKGDVWSFTVPPKEAYNPTPSDGMKFVHPAAALSWSPGYGAKLNYVYFGNDFDAVSTAEGGTAQTENTYVPGALEADKIYYWRVDEFDGAETHKGTVWSFTTVPDVAVTNPNLKLWLTLDEGQGATAVDWSGHGNHGTIVGGAQWADGYQCTALCFDGSASYVLIPHSDGLKVINQGDFAVASWIKLDVISGQHNFFQQADGNGTGRSWLFIQNNGEIQSWLGGSATASGVFPVAGTWYHVAVVVTEAGTADIVQMYVNGAASGTPEQNDLEDSEGDYVIGVNKNLTSQWFNGLIDDVRFYDKSLTAAEIQQLMLGDTKSAGNPVPERNDLVDMRDISSLSWSRGDTASSHDVYFGTDRDAVAGADSSAPEFQGNQTTTSLSLANLVEFGGGDYYWRIDEVQADGMVIAGTIWKFTVPDYLIVDDFESYDNIDPAFGEPGVNRIFDKWIDGYGTLTNGALVGNDLPPYAETNIVHGGAQSMIYRYDNAGKTSEATLTLIRGDWTVEGVTKLSLWLRGDAANAPDRIYVALNGTAVVYHDDPAATQLTGWKEWVINLSAFGIDLTNVQSISIGVGTRNAPSPAGGTGTVYFDDIRLIR